MQGVIVYFRVVDGQLRAGDVVKLMNTGKEYQVDEVGVLAPKQVPVRATSLSLMRTLLCIPPPLATLQAAMPSTWQRQTIRP